MPAITILAAVLASSTLTLARPTDDFCGFYDDDQCQRQSGSTTYKVTNDGVFQNGGAYFQCGTDKEISLISYPAGDSAGDTIKHCQVLAADQADFTCNHLDDLGFTTGDGGYYRITTDKVCPSGSSKRDVTVDDSSNAETGNSTMPEKRNANYFHFYADPECTVKSGSVDYSVTNDGCFENGGAYGYFPGDDFNWSIVQYAATGDSQCTGAVEHCTHSDPFISTGGNNPTPCVHLDDTGLRSGQGSYQILKGGCP